MKNNKISKLIKLDKPLVIFDIESTGLSISVDRIIEIAYLKIEPSGRIKSGDIFFNPEMSIPKEATEINGITNKRVADEPTFREKAQELWQIFNDCCYGGFNVVNFDLPLLRREFLRAGLDFEYYSARVIDSKTVFHAMEPRTLTAAYKFYCGKNHQSAHTAMGDAEVTAEILGAQLERYSEIRDWEFVNKIHHFDDDRFVDRERKFFWRDGQAHLAFSKHKGRSLAEVAEKERSFLEWILNADFSDETKEIVKKALNGELPKKA